MWFLFEISFRDIFLRYHHSFIHQGQTKWQPFADNIWNAFSWMKCLIFWFKFHWSLFLRVLSSTQLWFRWWIGIKQESILIKIARTQLGNYANPVYGVATICQQVRWLCWGHPSLFHIATSLLIWYEILCVRDISYRLIWVEFINMFSVYAQSGTHSRFNW